MKRLSTGCRVAIGDAETCAEVQYASGFRATDPVLLVDTPAARWLVVPQMELGRARNEAPDSIIETPLSLRIPRRARRTVESWALALLRRERIRRVSVLPAFPLAAARALERAGVRVDIAQDLYPERLVKSETEQRHIAASQRAAVAAMREAVRLIAASRPRRDGVLQLKGEALTSERVRLAIKRLLLEFNCECKMAIVAGGAQSADPHDQGHGALRAGEPIVIDIFPRSMEHGYWGDITRTVVKGRPPARLARMYRAVSAAHTEALRHVRAGVHTASIHAAVIRTFEARGFATGVVDGRHEGFIHSTGHGVGLQIHEAPLVGPLPGRLRRGQVVTIEPGLYYAHTGGVRIEDTVVVTAKGWRALATCARRFVV